MANSEQTPAEILKKIRALEIKTKGLVQTAFAGDYHSVFKGRGMNFDEVREYQPGDEIRAIDWNVTARLGTAFVVFFISDFQTGDFSRELAITGRRHDFIAVHVQDDREKVLPNVGIITLEDAETGEQIEINTADKSTRTHFAQLAEAQTADLT